MLISVQQNYAFYSKNSKKKKRSFSSEIAVLDQSYFPLSCLFVRIPTSDAEMLLKRFLLSGIGHIFPQCD